MSETPSRMRKQLRQARRALDPSQRLNNELCISKRLLRLPELQRCRRLGLYLSEDGEVDLLPLQMALVNARVQLFLPVLRPGSKKHLWFCPYAPGDRLRNNRFGIAEPITHKRPPVSLRSLDLVLVPLVGFDEACNRLGMGGGYYDRSFAFLRQAQWQRPRLVGVAHECQKVARLDPQPWDVPLDAVVTEDRVYS